MRIGFGYDVHPFVEKKPLFLGGVEIPYPRGLAGHSDADVLIHAICDALLGAMAEGDIGIHFPDTDPRYKGIRSTLLLESVARQTKKKGFRIVNVDTTVVCERPKLAPLIQSMREAIAKAADIEVGKVSVKATTTEGLGFSGREEGIAAYAVVLIEETLPSPE
jgi:2-C-methyl-D-erythritol 2,4-cyclodiphosphate synthase